ncbi:MAG: hypothetical protein IT384_03715 [Deltaproteobacteria bacterium]|nr:hypothetical protein [Deltaproteobacteria bacterium]
MHPLAQGQHIPRRSVRHGPVARRVVERNGERFEHFLAAEGDITRDLKTRMTRVEQHLGIGE